jgi:hypothetical protein
MVNKDGQELTAEGADGQETVRLGLDEIEALNEDAKAETIVTRKMSLASPDRPLDVAEPEMAEAAEETGQASPRGPLDDEDLGSLVAEADDFPSMSGGSQAAVPPLDQFGEPVPIIMQVAAELLKSPTPMGRAIFPDGAKAPIQYDPTVRAQVVHLDLHQMVPFGRLSEALFDLCGLEIGTGSMCFFREQAPGCWPNWVS